MGWYNKGPGDLGIADQVLVGAKISSKWKLNWCNEVYLLTLGAVHGLSSNDYYRKKGAGYPQTEIQPFGHKPGK